MDDGFNKLFYQSKTFSDVVSGIFPEDSVKRMSSWKLQRLVGNLVKYTSAEAGRKSVSMVNYKTKPRWWPRDVIFEFDLLSSEVKTRQFRLVLQRLVIKCCEFFRNKSVKQTWLPASRTKGAWINDENFESVKTRGIKRKKVISEGNDVKKRKTLTSKNESVLRVQQTFNRPVKAVVYLQDIFKVPKKPEPLTQQQFLMSLGLGLNNNCVATTSTVPHFSKLLKLHNCPHVPISSDVGKAIIKRENYVLPEYSTAKKIERLEWYINRSPPKKTPQHYEVTFVDNKNSDVHIYKFPKKQFNTSDQNFSFLLKMCKPLRVVIKRDDLLPEKKNCDNFHVSVVLPRLSVEQLNKYVCKDFNVCLTNTINRKPLRRLRSKKTKILK